MGKRIALIAVLSCVVLLGVTAFLLRDTLWEHYYLSKLDSSDTPVRERALENLVQSGSLRVLPVLVEQHVEVRSPVYRPFLRVALANRPGCLKTLQGLAADTDAPVPRRCYAVYLLSELGDTSFATHQDEADAKLKLCVDTARREAERKRKAGDQRGRLGLLVAEVQQGLVIQELVPGSPASRAGLQQGDAVVAVGEIPVYKLGDLAARLRDARVGQVVVFHVLRSNQRLEHPVAVDSENTWHKVLPKVW